ncbi:HesA/MoeB/ThiF family protein [Bacteroides sp. 214]|nr:HesA/MoeB/ThiF family protein [Bacteroides sp. 214]
MERYNRNILIDGIGETGQARLKASKVLVIGAGGLGSPVLLYLVAAGVGTIGIIDNDTVNVTNLQRQVLYGSTDLDKSKAHTAAEKLKTINDDCHIVAHHQLFTEDNAESFISKYDFVVDCSDNFATKYLINDTCVKLSKPYSHGAVVAMHGEVMTHIPGNSCLRSVFPTQPADGELPIAAEIGILGAVAGIIGSIQATETIKYLVGMDDLLINKLLLVDGRTMEFRVMRVKPTC